MNNIEKDLDPNGILSITLNRPEKLNALNQETLQLLSEIIEDVNYNNAIKGIILTGAGKAFCAGADIREIAECDSQLGYQFALRGQQLFRRLETIGKPSIAAINGIALGGGCELAMACTLRTASTRAQFGQPEVKLGLIPGYGGTQRLARLVGKGRAMELCITGHTLSAETAYNWGLVNRLFEPNTLLDDTKSVLHTILSMGPLAVKSAVNVIDRGFDLPLEDACHLEAMHFAQLCSTEDKHIGVNAFLNREQPGFKGK